MKERDRVCESIIVLGSGLSISNLTEEEIRYINCCKIVIAVNKFMLFYDKSKLLPNYVYFHDCKSEGDFAIFSKILEVCRRNDLEGMVFVTNDLFKYLRDDFPRLRLFNRLMILAKIQFRIYFEKIFRTKVNSERKVLHK